MIALLASLAATSTTVAGRVTDGSLAMGPVMLREGERAHVALAIVQQEGTCVASIPGLRVGERRCDLAARIADLRVRWFILRPLARDYDNVKACGPVLRHDGCHDPILYEEEEVPSLRSRMDFQTDDAPELARLGTHRLVARLDWGGTELTFPATTGPTPWGGVSSDLEVVVRRGDDYVGYVTELLGVPFSLFPVLIPGVGHQADARLAADCVALVIYGRRRMGESVRYVAPGALRRYLIPIGSAPALMSEDGRLAPITGVKVGDVLHFGFQTAVLSRLRGSIGRFGPDDLVIHAYHGVAEEIRLRDLPYHSLPVEILRWPEHPHWSASASELSPTTGPTGRPKALESR